jgi:hypothetical protein
MRGKGKALWVLGLVLVFVLLKDKVRAAFEKLSASRTLP